MLRCSILGCRCGIGRRSQVLTLSSCTSPGGTDIICAVQLVNGWCQCRGFTTSPRDPTPSLACGAAQQ